MLATLDLLSGGRVTFGAGLGGQAAEYEAFGESADPKRHASMVDEGLEVLDRLWSGERITYRGAHYTVDDALLHPTPVQRPRIPIWIGGESRAALRRAARWDGWIVGGAGPDGSPTTTPEQMAQRVGAIRHDRTSDAPFDVATSGWTAPGESGIPPEVR